MALSDALLYAKVKNTFLTMEGISEKEENMEPWFIGAPKESRRKSKDREKFKSAPVSSPGLDILKRQDSALSQKGAPSSSGGDCSTRAGCTSQEIDDMLDRLDAIDGDGDDSDAEQDFEPISVPDRATTLEMWPSYAGKLPVYAPMLPSSILAPATDGGALQTHKEDEQVPVMTASNARRNLFTVYSQEIPVIENVVSDGDEDDSEAAEDPKSIPPPARMDTVEIWPTADFKPSEQGMGPPLGHISLPAPPGTFIGVHMANAPTQQVEEQTTTLVMRSLPPKYTQAMLIEEIDHAGFLGTYDFFYLPMHQERRSNRGYAFINFIKPHLAQAFVQAFQGAKLWHSDSAKVVCLVPARIQGYQANKEHFSSTHAAQGDLAPRPLFLRELPSQGVRAPGPHDQHRRAQRKAAPRQLAPYCNPPQQMQWTMNNEEAMMRAAVREQMRQQRSLAVMDVANRVATQARAEPPPAPATKQESKSDVNFCGFCGGVRHSDFRFCQYCGKSFEMIAGA